MSGVIEDGKGGGYKAHVDDHGRLRTLSNVVSHMSHHASTHRNGYVGVMDTTLSSTSEEVCSFLQNTNTAKEIELYWIKVSSDSAVEINMYLGNTYTSGGVAIDYVNTYAGTSSALSVTAYEGGASSDIVAGTTTNDNVDGLFISSGQNFVASYDGGIILPYTGSFSIKATGAATNKVKVVLGFSLHATGTAL